MTNHRLRPLHEGDDAALLAIHIGAIMASGDQFYSPAERDSWAHGMTAQGYARSRQAGETFVVAIDDSDTPIGFCSWSPGRIIGLYVAANRQGSGVGSALLRHGEQALRDLGVTSSHIHASLPAVAFYQWHGYAITSQTHHTSRGGLVLASVLLEKPLGP